MKTISAIGSVEPGFKSHTILAAMAGQIKNINVGDSIVYVPVVAASGKIINERNGVLNIHHAAKRMGMKVSVVSREGGGYLVIRLE